jgi:hypothetical protein
MKPHTLFLALAAAAAFAAAQKIDTEFDESTDFSRFKTFTLRDGQINAKAAALNNELVRKKIENEIRKSLVSKGLTEVSAMPNLNVRYTLGAARRNEVDTYPAGWRGLRTRRVVTQYTEGTLVIDLRDTSKRALVWRAIAVEDKSNPSKVEDRLDEMVRKSFDKYPPKKK